MGKAQVSPRAAIHKECLWCCCDNLTEVKLCPRKECGLYPYRMRTTKEPTELTPLKAIRARCLDCSGGIAYDAINCTRTKCELYAFRGGRMPKTDKVLSEEQKAARRAILTSINEKKRKILKGGE